MKRGGPLKRTGPLQRRTRMRPKAKRETRERDVAYLGWLHGLPCIACEIEGPVSFVSKLFVQIPRPNPIEAAHQKHCDGVGGLMGKRPPDRDSCPLCAWHHRLAPEACDPAQRKFWSRLGVDVGDYCRALYAAFEAGESGAKVVRLFAGYR